LLGYKNVLLTNLKLYYEESLWSILQSSGAVAFTKKNPDFPQLYHEMSENGLQAIYRSYDLEKDLANCYKDFWEIVGTVQILYPKSDKLNNLIDKIYQLGHAPVLKEKPDNLDPDELLEWYRNEQKEIFRFVYQQMEPAVEDLLTLTPHHVGNMFNPSLASISLIFFGISITFPLSPKLM